MARAFVYDRAAKRITDPSLADEEAPEAAAPPVDNESQQFATEDEDSDSSQIIYRTRKRKLDMTEENPSTNKAPRLEADETYRCQLCRHVFSTHMNLRRHMQNMSNTGVYHCSICNLRYNDLQRYHTHNKNAHGSSSYNNFQCDFCKENFMHKSILSAHVVHYHLDPKKSGTVESLKPETQKLKPAILLKNIIPTSLKINLDPSSGSTTKSSPPKQRQSKLTDFLIRKCKTLPVAQPGPRSMKRAAFKKSEENLRTLNYFISVGKNRSDPKYDSYLAECFDCKPCSVVLERVEQVKRPIKIGNVYYYKGIPFRSPRVVLEERRHNSSVSTALDDFISSNLEIPSSLSSIFTCKVCGQELDTVERLVYHIRFRHTVYTSSICSARFTSIKKLSAHYAQKHRTQGSYECSICGDTPATYVELRKHYKIHCIPIDDIDVVDKTTIDLNSDCQQKNRALICVCGSSQTTKSSYKTHQKSCREWLKIRAAARKSVGLPQMSQEIKSQDSPQVSESSILKVEKVSPQKTVPPFVRPPSPPSSPEVIAQMPSPLPPLPPLPPPPPPPEVVLDEVRTEFVSVDDYAETDSVSDSPPPVSDSSTFQYVSLSDAQPPHPNNTYPCKVCDTQFKTLANYEKHVKIYNTGKQEVCKFCNSSFPSKQQMQNHISLTHVNFKALAYHCPVCNQGFNKKSSYRMHVKHIHASDLPVGVETIFLAENDPFENLRCEICKMSFDSMEEMKVHRKFYDPSVILCCASCEMEFQGDFALTQHNKMIHPGQSLYYAYNCNICGEGFANDNELNSHMLHVHTWASSDICNQQPLAMEVEAHSFSDNITTGVYVCVTCKMTFLDLEGLRVHRDEFVDDGDYQCHMCYKRYKTMELLDSHLQLTHMPVNNMVTFKCQLCGEVYLSAISLSCHEKHFHPLEMALSQPAEQLQLNQLDKNQTELKQMTRVPAFKTSVSTIINTAVARPLDRVQAIVKNSKNAFQCNGCKLSFADKISLEYHRLEYDNQGEFECNICNRKFQVAQHLQAHKDKHNEGVQYNLRCSVCSEGFSASSFLFMHVGHLHGLEELKKVLQRMSSKKDARPTQRNFSIELDDKTIHEVRISVKKNLLDSKFLKQIIVEAFTDFSAEFPQTTCRYDFQCRVCKLVFNSQANLNKHLIRYLKEGEYACKLCDKKFRWVANVEDHRRKHFNITCTNVFTCPICFERFVTNISLYAHKAHFHDRTLHMNSQMDLILAEDLKYPVQDTDTDINSVVDSANNGTCANGFSAGQDRAAGSDDHQTKQFTCRICYATFGNESNMMSHVVASHSEQPDSDQTALALCETSLNNYFLCSGCQTVFGSLQDLETHESTCSKFKCRDCDRIFMTDMQLKSHKETVHRSRQQQEEVEEEEEKKELKLPTKELASKDAGSSPSKLTDNRVGKLKVRSFAKLLDDHDASSSSPDSSRDSVIAYAQRSSSSTILKKVLEKNPVAARKPAQKPEEVEPRQPIHVSNNALSGKRLIVTWDNIYKLVKSTPNGYVDDLKSRIHPTGISVAFECKICRLLFLDERSLAAHMIRQCWENRCFVCSRTFDNSCTVLRHIETHHEIVCQVCGGVFLDSLSFNYHVSQCIEQVKTDCFKVSEEMHLTRAHLKELKEIICGLCRVSFKNIENATVHLKMTHCVYKCGICQAKFYGKSIIQQHMKSNHCNAPQFSVRFCDRCNTGHANFDGLSKHVCVR